MPFYVMEWKMRAGCPKKAFECFLGTGAPFPGVKMQRFHAPGSVNGWIIAETDDMTAIYAHAAEWAEFLEWNTTPVLPDEEAGATAAKVFPEFAK